MLEISLRFTIADDTSTDEALISGFSHDLRAIADQVARAWPGPTLDSALGEDGHLARPARLEVDLSHGGRASVEVRQRPLAETAQSVIAPAPEASRPARRSDPGVGDLQDLLADLAGPDRWQELQSRREFQAMLNQAEESLANARPDQAQPALRLARSFSGEFGDLVAKDRSGHWVSVSKSPVADPYYVCAVFGHADAVTRTPLPQILPEAAESRRSFSLAPETAQVLALLEQVVPARLAAVRAAGRDYLARRRQWMSQGRYSK